MKAVLMREEERGIVVCAWCRKAMGAKEGVEGVSHSICPDCREKFFPELDQHRAGREQSDIRMNMLCYEGHKLVAVQNVNPLTNSQLKACIECQQAIGREVVFELAW